MIRNSQPPSLHPLLLSQLRQSVSEQVLQVYGSPPAIIIWNPGLQNKQRYSSDWKQLVTIRALREQTLETGVLVESKQLTQLEAVDPLHS